MQLGARLELVSLGRGGGAFAELDDVEGQHGLPAALELVLGQSLRRVLDPDHRHARGWATGDLAGATTTAASTGAGQGTGSALGSCGGIADRGLGGGGGCSLDLIVVAVPASGMGRASACASNALVADPLCVAAPARFEILAAGAASVADDLPALAAMVLADHDAEGSATAVTVVGLYGEKGAREKENR